MKDNLHLLPYLLLSQLKKYNMQMTLSSPTVISTFFLVQYDYVLPEHTAKIVVHWNCRFGQFQINFQSPKVNVFFEIAPPPEVAQTHYKAWISDFIQRELLVFFKQGKLQVVLLTEDYMRKN